MVLPGNSCIKVPFSLRTFEVSSERDSDRKGILVGPKKSEDYLFQKGNLGFLSIVGPMLVFGFCPALLYMG